MLTMALLCLLYVYALFTAALGRLSTEFAASHIVNSHRRLAVTVGTAGHDPLYFAFTIASTPGSGMAANTYFIAGLYWAEYTFSCTYEQPFVAGETLECWTNTTNAFDPRNENQLVSLDDSYRFYLDYSQATNSSDLIRISSLKAVTRNGNYYEIDGFCVPKQFNTTETPISNQVCAEYPHKYATSELQLMWAYNPLIEVVFIDEIRFASTNAMRASYANQAHISVARSPPPDSFSIYLTQGTLASVATAPQYTLFWDEHVLNCAGVDSSNSYVLCSAGDSTTWTTVQCHHESQYKLHIWNREAPIKIDRIAIQTEWHLYEIDNFCIPDAFNTVTVTGTEIGGCDDFIGTDMTEWSQLCVGDDGFQTDKNCTNTAIDILLPDDLYALTIDQVPAMTGQVVDSTAFDLALTCSPTSEPTESPSKSPTKSPTSEPSQQPTTEPSHLPTVSPSIPTADPTQTPIYITTETHQESAPTEASDNNAAPPTSNNEIEGYGQIYTYAVVLLCLIFVVIAVAGYIYAGWIEINDFYQTGAVLVCLLQVLDVVSDAFLCAQIDEHKERDSVFFALFMLSVVFILFPILVSMWQLIREMNAHWWTTDNVKLWLTLHSKQLYLFSVLTGSSFAAVQLMNSNLFNLDMFSMNLSHSQHRSFQTKKLYSIVLFENLPQVILQSVYLSKIDELNRIAISSMIFSVVSIIVAVAAMMTEKKILYGAGYGVIEFNVFGSMKDPARCKNRVRRIRNEISSVFGLHTRLVEVVRPIAIPGGFHLRIYIHLNHIQSREINYKALISTAQQNGELARIFKDGWELAAIPTVSQIAFNVKESQFRQDNTVSIKVKSIAPGHRANVELPSRSQQQQQQQPQMQVQVQPEVQVQHEVEISIEIDDQGKMVSEIEMDEVPAAVNTRISQIMDDSSSSESVEDGQDDTNKHQVLPSASGVSLPSVGDKLAVRKPPVPAAANIMMPDSDEFMVTFATQPFGMKLSTLKTDKYNMYVGSVNPNSIAARNNVPVGAQLVAINGERVEGIGSDAIYQRVRDAKLPAQITFRKPSKQRKKRLVANHAQIGNDEIEHAAEDDKILQQMMTVGANDDDDDVIVVTSDELQTASNAQ